MKLPRSLATVVAVAVAAVLPLVLDGGALSVYVLMGLSATVVVGISLLMGFAGQVSLGQGAFYAIGAYTAGLLTTEGYAPLLGLAAAPVVAAVFALLVGVPLLRLRGHHLAFATIALHLIVITVASDIDAIGGSIGLQGIPRFSVGPLEFSGDVGYAYLAWAALGLVVLIAHNTITSRPGRALRALATSETAAESSGVPVGRYKLTVFAFSGAFAGLAGGVYAFYLGYISPGSFPVADSITFVVMAVVGGLGTIWGAVIGTAAVTVIVQWLNTLGTVEGMPDYAPSVLSYAVYGLLLILTMLFLPHGVVPALRERWARRRASAAPSDPPESAESADSPERSV